LSVRSRSAPDENCRDVTESGFPRRIFVLSALRVLKVERAARPYHPGMTLVLLANCAATWFMVGLIWFVQLVHYPQFADVGEACFTAYHRRHKRFTTLVVAPPMLIEAATAIWLAVRPGVMPAALGWIGLALVVVIWLSTAALQVPRHDDLARGFDATACSRLCSTNWLRTISWTARGLVMLYVVWGAVRYQPL
jgi:uncharacterized membrane protein